MLLEGVPQSLEQRIRAATADTASRRLLCVRTDKRDRFGEPIGQLGYESSFATPCKSNH